jgi:hypothetical protein
MNFHILFSNSSGISSKLSALVRLWVMTTFAMLFAATSASGADGTGPLCQRLGKLLSTRSGLVPYALEAIIDDRGIKRIPNVDVDGDNLSDEVQWSCPDAGGSVPVDSCALRVTLSSTKKTIEFARPKFYLVRLDNTVYIVSSTELRRKEEVGKSDVYRIDGSGITLVCKQL